MNEKVWTAIRTKWNRNYIYDFLKEYPDLSYSDLVNAPTTAEYEKLAELGMCSDDARPLWDTIARRKVKEIKKKKYMAQHFNDVSDTGSDNLSQQIDQKDKMIVRALYEIGNQIQNLNDNLCRFYDFIDHKIDEIQTSQDLIKLDIQEDNPHEKC